MAAFGKFMNTDSVTREELHHRKVDLRFFRRSDALYEVEGRLVDTKTHPFRRMLAKRRRPPLANTFTTSRFASCSIRIFWFTRRMR